MEEIKNKKSQLIGIGIMIVIIAGTILYVMKDESPEKIKAAILSVNPLYILAAIVLMCLYIMSEGVNIWITLRELKKPESIMKCFGYAFVGYYFSSITPSASGGQPAQIYFMKRDRIPVSLSSLTLMLILFAHQFVIIVFGVTGLIFDPGLEIGNVTGINILLIYGFLANGAVLLGILLLVFKPKIVFAMANGTAILLCKIKILKNRERIEKRISDSLAEYERGAIYMRRNPKVLLKVTIVTIFQIIFYFSVPYVIYKGFHLSGYSIWDLIFAQSILNIAVSSLPLPGGVGASESLFLTMFRIFYGAQLVIPGMLLTRISNFYIMLIVSGIISLAMYVMKKR